MKTLELRREQWLAAPIGDVFAFFADAANLQELTPPWLDFRILTPRPIEMRVGARIDYRLRLHRIPLTWRSEIAVWEPPHRFVDEQRRGPYRLWVHEHRFEPERDGTLVRDHVRYAVPGGALVHRFVVGPDLERIFDYRQRRLRELFGGEAGRSAGRPATGR